VGVLSSFLQALGLFFSVRTLRRLAIRPWGFGFFSYLLLGWGALSYHSTVVHALGGWARGWWHGFLYILSWITVTVLLLCGVTLGSFLVVAIGASFFQEALVRRALELQQIALPARAAQGAVSQVKELGLSVGHEVAKFLVFLPVLFVTVVLGLFSGIVPLLAPVVFVVAGWSLGFQLFDPVLEAYGLSLRARLQFSVRWGWALFFLGAVM
jgi:uncharacterized protein involved in cysteine biosynthesis